MTAGAMLWLKEKDVAAGVKMWRQEKLIKSSFSGICCDFRFFDSRSFGAALLGVLLASSQFLFS